MDRLERHASASSADRLDGLARKALTAYGLDGARLTRLSSTVHTTFEVSIGDPSRHYALRICSADRPLDDLQREILWLTALRRDAGLPVPEPILSMDGKLVHKVSIAGVSGVRPCVLLRWIEGESLDSELAPEHLRRVGRLVAALHAHAETFRWPEEITPPRRNATLISEVLDERLLRAHYDDPALRVFQDAVEVIATTMATLRDGPHIAGVIHADLHRRNVLFHDDEVGLIGFDRCRWGYYAYDLAVVRSWIERRENREVLVMAFADGYRAVRPLSEDIGESVPVFATLRSIDRIQSILSRPDRGEQSTGELDRAYETVRGLLEAP